MPTTTPFNNLITFSRGSNATVTGSNGLIQWAPNNLLTFSEQFDNAAWTKSSTGTTPNTAVAPDGTTTADSLLETSTNTSGDNRLIRQDTASAISGTVTYTAYIKANGRDFAYVSVNASPYSGGTYFGINLSTGATFVSASYGTGVTLVSNGAEPLPNGWYRLRVTASLTSAVVVRCQINVSATSDTTVSYPGDITKGLFVWGAQLELGSTATTYNPTTVKNLLGFSEAFDNAAWTKTRASIVTGAAANPVNGLFNAQKLMEDTTASSSHSASQSFTTIVGTSYTFSAYIKAAGRTFAAVYLSGPNRGIYINLTTGAYAGDVIAAPTSYRIDAIGSGWYRVSVTAAAVATSTNAIVITANSTPDYVYTGDGNSGVYIYGAQLSDSASLDPYVPTPGAAPSSTAFYGPRFDFDPVTLQPRGLLVEEQRTNLLLYSDDLSPSGTWPRGNVTVTPNTTTAPDGTLTADTVAATTTGTFRYIYQSVTLTNAVTYTLTVYLKYKTARYVWLLGETSGDAFAIFDLLTGTVGSATAGVTRSITPVGNGWYRCSATFTVSSATGAQQIGFGLSDTDTVANPSATAGIDTFAWGLQVEAGAFATSYIPTVASTVTRSADVATISGSLFSQWYGQTEGSFVVSGSGITGAQSYWYQTDDGTGNNRVASLIYLSSARGWVFTGGVSQAQMDAVNTLVSGTVYNTSLAYKTNDFAYVLNGGAVVTDTSGTVPIVDRLRIGASSGGTGYLNGHIRNIRFIPARAADFQLQALTAQTIVDYFFLQTATGDQLVDGNGDELYSLPIFG